MSELLCDQCYHGPFTGGHPDAKEGDRHVWRYANAPSEECGIFHPKLTIPEMEDDEVLRRFKKIKPLFNFNAPMGLSYIQDVHLKNVAYTWNPNPRLLPPRGHPLIGSLKPFDKITTLHTWGYYGFFKPSIGEVLRQIPEKYLGRCVAFQITSQPDTADDLNKDLFAINSGVHVAETTLYERG